MSKGKRPGKNGTQGSHERLTATEMTEREKRRAEERAYRQGFKDGRKEGAAELAKRLLEKVRQL